METRARRRYLLIAAMFSPSAWATPIASRSGTAPPHAIAIAIAIAIDSYAALIGEEGAIAAIPAP